QLFGRECGRGGDVFRGGRERGAEREQQGRAGQGEAFAGRGHNAPFTCIGGGVARDYSQGRINRVRHHFSYKEGQRPFTWKMVSDPVYWAFQNSRHSAMKA